MIKIRTTRGLEIRRGEKNRTAKLRTMILADCRPELLLARVKKWIVTGAGTGWIFIT
jgi:hypothetical protein